MSEVRSDPGPSGGIPGWLRRRRRPRLSGALRIRDAFGLDVTIALRGRDSVLTDAGTGLPGHGEVWAVHTDADATETSLMISYGRTASPASRESGLCPPGGTITLSGTRFTWHPPAIPPHRTPPPAPAETGAPPTGTGAPPAETSAPPAETSTAPTETSTAPAPTETGAPPTPARTGPPPPETGLPPAPARSGIPRPRAGGSSGGIAARVRRDPADPPAGRRGLNAAPTAGHDAGNAPPTAGHDAGNAPPTAGHEAGNAAPAAGHDPGPNRNARTPLPRSGNTRPTPGGLRQRVRALVRNIAHSVRR
ncbi:hypothetical protein [Actinoplanes teichomyceticus]|uniref:Uncharacterized protein n=1 Tax=Actinoplanes teichomyceticus TaxID=1867 RepID=A0A561WA72_ACTTI|nr:hypothetical protein [Actinoplanes teichomyceticus]TWG20749.1 hypothetical protein FHX34_103278 [Actinoplanes teichomyceticus]GIF14405.1 hypothetical protein Ate01nite_44370 [Actinoplanes teichomyceticus]